MVSDWGGRLSEAARHVMDRPRTQSELSQLRAAATLEAMRPESAALPDFRFTDSGLADIAYLVRMAELARPARERRRRPGRLPTVAAAFEDLADRSPVGSPRRRELLGQAASMWSVAGYQANSVVLAERLEAEIQANADQSIPSRFAQLVAALLLRDIAFAERLGREAVAAVPELADVMLNQAGDEPVAVDDAAVLAAYGLVGQAAIDAVQFWRLGDEGARGAAPRAIAAVQQAAQLLLDADVVDTWLLADNLGVVLADAFAASLWRGLRGRAPLWNNLWRRHIRLLAADERPMVEIWPSQRQGLEAGLLDPARTGLVARMPTSAGKTRMAEFAILAALADRTRDRLAAYVVPSRALAAEVERRLSGSLGEVGLRVSALFGGFENVDYELVLVENTDVLIVTPEKLDLLLRQDNSLTARLALAIFDEGHLLADLERGLRLELLITRLRRRVPLVRVILLSAVLPNVEEIGAWLEPAGGGTNVVDVNWSPSRLATGVFFWQGSSQDGQFGRVRYAGHDEQFFVPYILRRQRLRTNLYPSTKSETAAELALHYRRLGPVIVGAATKPTVTGVTHALESALRRHSRTGKPIDLVDPARAGDLRQLASIVGATVGADHELVGFVLQGFAYHHADVPEELRLAIERAFRGGALRILVATSTLSQGVNLPVKTVIVSHTYRNERQTIPVAEFWNLAGRAGRALEETEGHVVLVADNESEAYRLQNRYLDPTKVERVESVLYRLCDAIARARLPGRNITGVGPDTDLGEDPLASGPTQLDALDVQLLAIAAEEIVDTDDESAIASILGETLCSVQLARTNVPIGPFSRYLARRFGALKARVPNSDQRRSYYRTGLSLQGCEALLSAIDGILAADATMIDPDRFDDLRRQLLVAATCVPEFLTACAQYHVPPTAIPDLAISWMDGATLPELRAVHAARLGVRNAMEFSARLERNVIRDLPWMLSAAVEFIKLRRGADWEPPDELSALPAMVKFGLPNVSACYAASVGLRRREVARAVGQAFAARGGGSFGRFLAWLSSLAPEEIASLVSGDDARAVVNRVAVLAGTRESLKLLAEGQGTIRADLRGLSFEGRWNRVVGLSLPSSVTLEREPGNPYDPNAVIVRNSQGEILGYVAREVARAVAPLLDADVIASAEVLSRTSDDASHVGAATVHISLRLP